MFRVGIVDSKGKVEAKNFKIRDEVDNYILSFENLKHFRILKDGKLIETERGKIK